MNYAPLFPGSLFQQVQGYEPVQRFPTMIIPHNHIADVSVPVTMAQPSIAYIQPSYESFQCYLPVATSSVPHTVYPSANYTRMKDPYADYIAMHTHQMHEKAIHKDFLQKFMECRKMIGKYTKEQRTRRLELYRKKRLERNYNARKIRYAVRKTISLRRARSKGRFTKCTDPQQGTNPVEVK